MVSNFVLQLFICTMTRERISSLDWFSSSIDWICISCSFLFAFYCLIIAHISSGDPLVILIEKDSNEMQISICVLCIRSFYVSLPLFISWKFDIYLHWCFHFYFQQLSVLKWKHFPFPFIFNIIFITICVYCFVFKFRCWMQLDSLLELFCHLLDLFYWSHYQ